MGNNLKNEEGFTLIELVMTIVILGILAAVAIPRFVSLQEDAQAASHQAYIGGLRAAIAIQFVGQLLCKPSPVIPDVDVMEGTGNLAGTLAPNCNQGTVTNTAPTATASTSEGLVQGNRPDGLTITTAGACDVGAWTGRGKNPTGTIDLVTWTLTCPLPATRGPLTIVSTPAGF